MLVGEWRDAIDAAEVTTVDVHGRASSHEELWCFDIEGMLTDREMSPAEATVQAELLESVAERQRPAFRAWSANGNHVEGGDGLPSVSDFEERYCGEWDSFDDFASNYADDTGLLAGIPDEIQRHFDWKSWTSELADDYTTCEADTGVHVFRSY